jgi:hypothetical protein
MAGLSESELPKDKCPEGFTVMAVHGLSPSAASGPRPNLGVPAARNVECVKHKR